MDDIAMQSAANTLGNWRARRDAKGKPPTEEDARREAAARWPDMTAKQIVEAARLCIERRKTT